MKGNAPHSYLTNVPGWETGPEQDLLLRLAKDVPKKGLIIEIGGEFGQSASLFAMGADRTVKIITVDQFPGDLLSIHQENLKEAGFEGRTEQIVMDSRKMKDQTWGHGQVNLLFIDGDHSYEGVKDDIEGWIPHVKTGGIVAFHDCASETNKLPHVSHFEVTRAVSEWFFGTKGKWSLIHSVDSLMVFRKDRA